MKKNNGFTLIELMITVAIIGILVAVGLPIYSRYQDKALVQASLYEISAPKAQFEVQVNEGNTNLTLADLGIFSASSANCSLIAYNYDPSILEWSLAGTPAIPTDLKPSNCS